jgi:hypothetical protein
MKPKGRHELMLEQSQIAQRQIQALIDIDKAMTELYERERLVLGLGNIALTLHIRGKRR